MNLFTYIKEHISIVTVAQEYVTIKKGRHLLQRTMPPFTKKKMHLSPLVLIKKFLLLRLSCNRRRYFIYRPN